MRFYSDRLGRVADRGGASRRTWFGEDYGHWLPPGDEVSIATECATPLGSRQEQGLSGPARARATE